MTQLAQLGRLGAANLDAIEDAVARTAPFDRRKLIWQFGFPVPEMRDFFVGEVWKWARAGAAYLERRR